MNYKTISFVFVFLLLSIPALIACRNCLDTSWHLERCFDTKEYHPAVTQYGNKILHCQCPCRKLTLDRGKCLECGHRHIMPEMHIIRYNRCNNYS